MDIANYRIRTINVSKKTIIIPPVITIFDENALAIHDEVEVPAADEDVFLNKAASVTCYSLRLKRPPVFDDYTTYDSVDLSLGINEAGVIKIDYDDLRPAVLDYGYLQSLIERRAGKAKTRKAILQSGAVELSEDGLKKRVSYENSVIERCKKCKSHIKQGSSQKDIAAAFVELCDI